MELFKILGTIAIDSQGAIEDIDATTKRASKAEGTISKAFKKIGTAIVTYLAVDKIAEFGKSCISAAADAQAMASQFSQVFGDLEGQATSSLSSIAKQAGVTENRMKGSYTKIAAFAKTTGMQTADALAIADRAMVAVADSAAFYDRTLEETTESLQSFLKGNFENDAALGLSCTETTRNAAANELYGKSFNKLSEAQKQLTLLKMVEDANELSGALGQAARESDTWTNQTGNLKQAWTDFKAEIGEHVLPVVVDLVGRFSEFVNSAKEKIDPTVQTLTEKFQNLKDWLSDIGTYASTTFAPIIADLEPVFNKVKDAVQFVVDKFSEYVTSGEAAEDITNTLKTAIDLVADGYEKVKGFIEDCITAWQNAQTWINEHQTAVQLLGAAFITLTTAIGLFTAAQAIANAGGIVYLAQLAATAVGVYALDVAQKIAAISGAAFGAVMAFITSPITLVVLAIGALVAAIVLCVKHWDVIKAKIVEVATRIGADFVALWESIKATWEGIKSTISEKVEAIKSAVSAKWQAIKSAIMNPIEEARDKVQEAIEKIKGFFDFNISWPHIPMPHFSVSPAGWKIGDLLKGEIPSLGIEWYAKAMDNPMLMTDPTIFGFNPNTGSLMGGGEKGDEVVSGADTLMNMIGAAVEAKTSEQTERLIAVMTAVLEAILSGNQELLRAILAGHVIKLNGREVGRTVRTYA